MSAMMDRWIRLRSLITRKGVEREVDEELSFHLEMRARDYEREGFDSDEARRLAYKRFGNLGRVRSEALRSEQGRVRRRRWLFFLDELRQDLRYAARQLTRQPVFTFVVVLTLALGIGANVAIFSALKGLILRPIPYPEPDRIVALWETETGHRYYMPFTGPDYFDMVEQNSSFEEIGVYTFRWLNLVAGDEPERIRGSAVTASVLRILGMPPPYGRLFIDEEEKEGSNHVAIISDGLWRRSFDADPNLVGQYVTVNRESYRVVGVLPADFEFPSPWGRAEPVEMLLPLTLPTDGSGRGSHGLAAIGRLREDVTVAGAESDIRTIAARLAEQYPTTNAQVQVWIEPLMRRALGSVTVILMVLLFVVGFVLLVACANVASMLLARGAARQSEVALRASMGAGGGRLIRQLLTESMFLAFLGGIAGTLLAVWSMGALKGLIPSTIPRVEGIRIDGWVLLFAFGIMVVTGLIFGLAPARFAVRTNLVDALKGTGGSRTGGRKRNRMLKILVVGQLAMALLLVNSATLLFVSYLNIAAIPRGYDTEEVLITDISLAGQDYDKPEGRTAFWERLIARVRAIPGVEEAGVTTKLPANGGNNSSILVEGETYDPHERRPLVERSYISPQYFDAMGISLLAGRTFEDGEGIASDASDTRVTIVNQAFVDRYWPEGEAVGQLVRHNSEPPAWTATVVGVVEDVRQWGLVHPAIPEMYAPFRINPRNSSYLVMRSAVEPISLAPAVRQAVLEIDPQQPVSGFYTMAEMVKGMMQGRRHYTLLVGLFTLTAVILAIAGTYGVMSFYVTQRVREIGVRMALGAARSHVLWFFVNKGLRLSLLGGFFGLWFAFASSAVISSLVYGIRPIQILYLAGAMLFITVVAIIASTVPALRATRVDPVQALRAG